CNEGGRTTRKAAAHDSKVREEADSRNKGCAPETRRRRNEREEAYVKGTTYGRRSRRQRTEALIVSGL
ncbi:hypothetical protein HN51_040468, partial [Arachis hypogaea]